MGGTGGKVLAALRRQIYQQYRSAEPAALAVDYLYIDTSATDTRIADITSQIAAGDRMWRTLGHSVQLSPGQIVHLEQADFSGMLSNLDDYPTIRKWIGEKSVWEDIWNSAPNGIEAGGQLRRFGRLLFAQNVRKVSDALKNRLVARQTQDGVATTDWTIHIFAGLAGGTGSGTFIDLVGQLRKLAAGRTAKIILYVVLPETQDTSWAKENYYANGYAALAELNAAVVKQQRLSDVAEERGTYDNNLPVDNCFIITNRNENGLIVNTEKLLPQIVAESVYQIVIASGDARAQGAQAGDAAGADQRAWRDMVTGENYFGQYEKDAEGAPDARANRFMAFGIKRIAIPHQEVREYSTMVFLRQYLLRALHDNWVDGIGFEAASRPFDAAHEVRNETRREAWGLTNEHLRLERKLLDNDAGWRSLRDEFTAALTGRTEALISEGGKNDGWAAALQSFARDFYERENGFRRSGVPEFYQVAERSIPDRARFIVRNRIAATLFDEWKSCRRPIRDVERLIDELIVDVNERIGASEKKIADLIRQQEQKDADAKKLFGDYVNSNAWNPLTDRKKMLRQLSLAYVDAYSLRAGQVAQAFMKKTLMQVLTELQALNAAVEATAARLEAASITAENRRTQRVQVGQSNIGSHQYKFYDPDHVRQVIARLQSDNGLQTQQTLAVASALANAMGTQASFVRFAETMSEGRILEVLEGVAEEKAEEALAAMESERDRILQSSIIQKLYEEYAGQNEALRRFVSERVREAGSFAAFSRNESLARGGAAIARCLVAFVPSDAGLPDHIKDFRLELLAAIRQASDNVAISETHDRGHEIVFLSLVNQFPLRFLSALEFLKEKHDRLVSGPGAVRKRLELYLEGDGTTLPSLYAPSADQLRQDAAPYWLIAECAGLLAQTENNTTGAKEVRLKTTDADGRIRVHLVGDRLENGTKGLTPANALMLKSVVSEHLATLVHIDQRNALKKQIIDRQNAVLEQAGFDPNHPSVVAMESVARKALELLGV
ncbi:tubulin-like doman-containing protein [Sandarakinorhabdus cyanobacteriorum]|uniref:tubulin-like doman-containing protein n=1 Tax=Sandarakinorhabdus cyanobacteriorum TaxID=1981098 RepID=UPI001FB000DF|nr:tubulin-like doman-containing protein [Sandarakinorhabdus cyanobacteriorum]